uniref:Protein-L-isoaspartate O-methyltransferase n=1 Tax=Bradyrhizobium japonicum TaxID=375 RepID=Q9RHC5_BRAJP|nr:putative methyltransferase [Bradyrhizobium japonicum]
MQARLAVRAQRRHACPILSRRRAPGCCGWLCRHLGAGVPRGRRCHHVRRQAWRDLFPAADQPRRRFMVELLAGAARQPTHHGGAACGGVRRFDLSIGNQDYKAPLRRREGRADRRQRRAVLARRYLTHGATMPRRACAAIPGWRCRVAGDGQGNALEHAPPDCRCRSNIAIVVLSSSPFHGGDMEDRSAKYRAFYAQLICARREPRIPVSRRPFGPSARAFVGPGPWSICLGGHPYVVTPDDDPAFIYQNTLLALDSARGLNIGMPGAHAHWLSGCAVKEGETVIQIGAGSGYYTAILAHLVGPGGRVHAYEIDQRLAGLARENLRDIAHADVHDRSGIASDLPAADVIYVCAGAAHRPTGVLEALRPGGRAGVSVGAGRHARRYVDDHAS